MKDEQYENLIKYLQAEFDSVRLEISATNNRLTALEEAFAQLFGFMVIHFAEIEAELETKASKTQLNAVYNLLDVHTKQRETDEQERLFMAHQLDRHEGWIQVLGKKTNTELTT